MHTSSANCFVFTLQGIMNAKWQSRNQLRVMHSEFQAAFQPRVLLMSHTWKQLEWIKSRILARSRTICTLHPHTETMLILFFRVTNYNEVAATRGDSNSKSVDNWGFSSQVASSMLLLKHMINTGLTYGLKAIVCVLSTAAREILPFFCCVLWKIMKNNWSYAFSTAVTS